MTMILECFTQQQQTKSGSRPLPLPEARESVAVYELLINSVHGRQKTTLSKSVMRRQ